MEKLILNPSSGQGRGARLKTFIKREMNLRDDEIFLSKNREEIRGKAREMAEAGIDPVIVAGGDGGFNFALNGIIAASLNTRMGFIPLGMSNICALSSGIPKSARAAIELIKKKRTKSFSLARVETENLSQVFFNSLDFGYTSEISNRAETNRTLKLLLGKGSHALTAVFLFLFKNFPLIEVLVNGNTYRTTQVAVFNGPYLGGKFKLVDADPQDRQLEIALFKGKTKMQFILSILKVLMGRDGQKYFRIEKADSAEVYSQKPLALQLDGEPFAPVTHFKVSFHSKRMELIC
ncbi:MAG TPA: diacylglycerol kinase family protein [bacterium]|nr:diacylglycerol kinase family protein [bacterium]